MVEQEKDDAASRSDEDNPEWTREEIRTARPAIEAMGEFSARKQPRQSGGVAAGRRRRTAR